MTPWTRRRAHALRVAYREVYPATSNEAYAYEVGIAPRTIYEWAKYDDETPVRAGTHQALNTFFEGVPTEVKACFYAKLDTSPSVTHPLGSTDPKEAVALVTQEVVQDLVLDSASVSDALEVLQSNVQHAARDYSDRSPMSELESLRSLRSACRALDLRAKRPGDRREMFALTGMSTALLASVAFDIGQWPMADQLAQAAVQYGAMSGHDALAAWTLGLQATVAFWDDRPGQALAAIERGLASAPSAASRFRLHHIAARAYAIGGDQHGTGTAIARAEQERELMDGSDELHDSLGGEFSFTDVRATACAAAALLQLGEGAGAEAYAERTLRSYQNTIDPYGRGPARGATIDLATARILQHNVDGTADALAPILSLPIDRRTISLAGRLEKTRDQLRKLAPTPGSDAHNMLRTLDEWLRTARQVQHA